MTAIPSLLNYGLLGLSALIVFLFWRVISKEQERDGQPRLGIVRMSWLFIVLSILLASAALGLELTGVSEAKDENQVLREASEVLKSDNQILREKSARLEERALAQIELIKRLDKQLASFNDSLASVRTYHTKGPKTGIRSSGATKVSLPELVEAKQELMDSVAEMRKSLEEELGKANQSLEPTP